MGNNGAEIRRFFKKKKFYCRGRRWKTIIISKREVEGGGLFRGRESRVHKRLGGNTHMILHSEKTCIVVVLVVVVVVVSVVADVVADTIWQR